MYANRGRGYRGRGVGAFAYNASRDTTGTPQSVSGVSPSAFRSQRGRGRYRGMGRGAAVRCKEDIQIQQTGKEEEVQSKTDTIRTSGLVNTDPQGDKVIIRGGKRRQRTQKEKGKPQKTLEQTGVQQRPVEHERGGEKKEIGGRVIKEIKYGRGGGQIGRREGRNRRNVTRKIEETQKAGTKESQGNKEVHEGIVGITGGVIAERHNVIALGAASATGGQEMNREAEQTGIGGDRRSRGNRIWRGRQGYWRGRGKFKEGKVADTHEKTDTEVNHFTPEVRKAGTNDGEARPNEKETERNQEKKRQRKERKKLFKDKNKEKRDKGCGQKPGQCANPITIDPEYANLKELPFSASKERITPQDERRNTKGEDKRFKGGKREQRGKGKPAVRSLKSDKHNPEKLKRLKKLREMCSKDPDTVVLELTSDRNMSNTEKLLSDDLPMEDTEVIAFLEVLARASECSTVLSSLNKLLSKLPKSKYMNLYLSNYINRLANEDMDFQERERQLRLMIRLFTEMLKKLPSSFADLPIPQLLFATMMLSADKNLLDETILPAVEELNSLKDSMAENIKQEEELAQDNRKPKRISRKEKAALHDNDMPPEDFRNLSSCPTSDDILSTEVPFLRRNKTDGRYNSTEDYLDVQFRLLREDFVRPLREGINELLFRMGSPKTGPIQDIRVYRDVRILYPVSTNKGMAYKISFDISGLKGVRWENTKRLIYGSLLCLSKDNFETFILATVENRDARNLHQGQLEVRLADPHYSNQIDLPDQSFYQMVETTAYFEAYRHVLDGLQVIEPRRFPFKRYIVKCKQDSKPPAYLSNRFRETVTYDFAPIMSKTTSLQVGNYEKRKIGSKLSHRHPSSSKYTERSVRILDESTWPSAQELELDDAQYEAVKHALTSEFALIQGPPGTGKTYIGLKVAKVLLHNKSIWASSTDTLTNDSSDEENNEPIPREARRTKEINNHPILVVCYTNHALDQFLEGIHAFHPKGIIRVGSRSQSEIMQKCSLGEIKRNLRLKTKMDKARRRADRDDYWDEFDKELPDPEVLRNAPCQEIPWDIRHYCYEANEKLRSCKKPTHEATENLQKCMEKVIHEKELHRYNCMSDEHYTELTVDPNTGMKTKQSVLYYWLGLIDNSPFESSYFVEPIATFPFNEESQGANILIHNHTAIISNAVLAPGPFDSFQDSYELQGTQDSFILIPNMENGFLDTHHSMSIVVSVYPMGPLGGPIVCFQDQGLIGILISQDGVEDGKGVLTAAFNCRDGTPMEPLRRPVLHMNEWNCIAATYDFNTGLCRLWHEGVEVLTSQINDGWQEIGSQFSVYLGGLNIPWHSSYFQGRVCNLNIFPEAIGKQQILNVTGIFEDDGEEQIEDIADSDDFLFEAQAEQNRRMLDNDDDIDYNVKKKRVKNSLATADQSTNYASSDPNAWQHAKTSGKAKHQIKNTIKIELRKKDLMTSEEARAVFNVWELSVKDRWRLYRYWMDQLASKYMGVIRRYHDGLETAAQILSELRTLEDEYILERSTVIGMTTTGAAKYRHLIQVIQPRIVIVEEAAEVLESHIVTSLSPGCQHLILIGDHQQLRPSPTVYDLAINYGLEMSLFERMVDTGVPFKRLNSQHRMRPEIAAMMSHIYNDLHNHESVEKFESIMGVDSNIFFIDHKRLEVLVKEGQSRSNHHEAEYLVALCRYFIFQGYKPEQITILTMYTGQLLLLKKEMPREFFNGVRVCAVDNFQGEENDIILLSLVRSNDQGNIGFLKIANRVCVALSRAKKGFYCIGNLELLCAKNTLWNNIIEDMQAKGRVGPFLTLRCQRHPVKVIQASNASDFSEAPLGGCKEPCNTRLDCGHVCGMTYCHPADPNHLEYRCLKKCTRMVCEDHSTKCTVMCYEKCDVCKIPVTKEIPGCLHKQNVCCYMDPSEVFCQYPCDKLLTCEHHCKGMCGQCSKDPDHEEYKCAEQCRKTICETHSTKCTKRCFQSCERCNVLVTKEIPTCHHEQQVPCCLDPAKFKCKVPCNARLDCEHHCKGTCGECLYDPNHEEYKCSYECKKIVCQNHSTKCTKVCCETCEQCKVLVTKEIPDCHHEQQVPCCLDPAEFDCKMPCDARLDCKHHCKGTCGKCRKDPGHKEYKCREKCKRIVCETHSIKCSKRCCEKCDVCKVLVAKEIPNCHHVQQVPCHIDPVEFQCKDPCRRKLPCGQHRCEKKCFEPCNSACEVIMNKTLKCGHVNKVKCQENLDNFVCFGPCGVLLNCKHRCSGKCVECFQGRLHLPCNAKCRRRLLCGHTCKDACKKNCPPCKEKCENGCVHNKCTKKCAEPCTPCMLPCEWKCPHYQCTQLCSEPCDRPRCNESCEKTLQCGHHCIGMCGEPCPKKCRICGEDEVTEVRFGGEDEPNARFVELEACGHLFEVNAMDRHMDGVTEAEESRIQLKGCPRCHTPIRLSVRYGSVIKRVLADIDKVKSKLTFKNEQLRQQQQRLRDIKKVIGPLNNDKASNDIRQIFGVLFTKKLTTSLINMYENKINFLHFLSIVINITLFGTSLSLRKLKAKLSIPALALSDRIMRTNQEYSDQEKEEIVGELLRVLLIWSHRHLLHIMECKNTPVSDSRLEDIAGVLGSGQKIDNDDIDKYMRVIQNVCARHNLGGQIQELAEKGKQLIVENVRMEQGHWFKCSKDHVFYIAKPGGAMNSSHCVECKSAMDNAESN